MNEMRQAATQTKPYKISVLSLTGKELLAGKSDGLRDFPTFLSAVENAPIGATIVIDWSEIDLVTASYFASTLLQLLRMCIAGDIERYIINTGLSKAAHDDLKLALQIQGLVTLSADFKANSIRNTQVIGNLEEPSRETLELLRNDLDASATELFEKYSTLVKIGKTAWINRLTSLHQQRLIQRTKIGREYKYRLIA